MPRVINFGNNPTVAAAMNFSTVFSKPAMAVSSWLVSPLPARMAPKPAQTTADTIIGLCVSIAQATKFGTRLSAEAIMMVSQEYLFGRPAMAGSSSAATPILARPEAKPASIMVARIFGFCGSMPAAMNCGIRLSEAVVMMPCKVCNKRVMADSF